MKPVVQEEKTGCGIASSAAIAGISYCEAKNVANGLGIFADDQSLWSDTAYIRRILDRLGFKTANTEFPFTAWEALPDCALLSIKWRQISGSPFWHWVVFVREGHEQYVLDSKKALKTNKRTDFGRMRPKWFIPVTPNNKINRIA